jgi:hypothetical protein
MEFKMKQVRVEVTNQGAVYVNDTRITGRDTKWGIHQTMFAIKVPANKVTSSLVEHGYGHIKLDKDYMKELGVV